MLSKHICTPVKNKAINDVLMECENAQLHIKHYNTKQSGEVKRHVKPTYNN